MASPLWPMIGLCGICSDQSERARGRSTSNERSRSTEAAAKRSARGYQQPTNQRYAKHSPNLPVQRVHWAMNLGKASKFWLEQLKEYWMSSVTLNAGSTPATSTNIALWSSWSARKAHNLEVGSSNLPSATKLN